MQVEFGYFDFGLALGWTDAGTDLELGAHVAQDGLYTLGCDGLLWLMGEVLRVILTIALCNLRG